MMAEMVQKLLETLPEDCSEALRKYPNMQHALGVQPREMEELYHKAYLAYENENMQEAASFFRLLVFLDPLSSKYWMGFAAAQQVLEKYENALHGYAMVSFLDSRDPYPHYHAYECYTALNEPDEAKKALRLALKRSDESHSLKKTLEALL